MLPPDQPIGKRHAPARPADRKTACSRGVRSGRVRLGEGAVFGDTPLYAFNRVPPMAAYSSGFGDIPLHTFNRVPPMAGKHAAC